MGIADFVKGIFKPAPQEVPQAPSVQIDTVHHEIFIGEAAAGKWPWLCRVYDQSSAATEKNGVADTEQGAIAAAQAWAEPAKAALRGAP